MTHARNRALREELYRANITRASVGDIDNTPIIEQVRVPLFYAEMGRKEAYRNWM